MSCCLYRVILEERPSVRVVASAVDSRPRNGGSPPKDNSDVNIINFISVVSLFVIMVWLINDVPESLMADTTVSASVE